MDHFLVTVFADWVVDQVCLGTPEVSDLLNSHLYFLGSEDSSHSPSDGDTRQEFPEGAQLGVHGLHDRPYVVSTPHFLDLRDTVNDVVLQDELLGELQVHERVFHPVKQLPYQRNFLNFFEQTVHLDVKG